MFGELEGKKIPLDLVLYEFRSIFDHLNAEGPNVIKNVMKESVEFATCYNRFFACQGKAVRKFNMYIYMCVCMYVWCRCECVCEFV
jgi:hypothetical protein